MKPLANFQCAKCECKIEDLPIDSKCCPYCGARRGFIRLFDGIGGIRTSRAGAVHAVIDDSLGPLFEKSSAVAAGAARFDAAADEALDKSFARATPSERAQLDQFRGHDKMLPAASALGAIPPGARQDSRELLYPALTGRKVAPQWQK